MSFSENDNLPDSETSISLLVPNVMLTHMGLGSSTGSGKLSVMKSEMCKRTLVDLAGLLYQTVLMLQIHTPDVFSSAAAMYPESVLCIMRYSCSDSNLIRKWIETFKNKKWLKPMQYKLGKRKHTDAGRNEVMYHCTGCRNFYRDLFSNNVPEHKLIQCVYGQDKRRKIGQCVNERRWLS